MSLYWCFTFKFRIYKYPELAKVEVKGTILRLLNQPTTSDTSYKIGGLQSDPDFRSAGYKFRVPMESLRVDNSLKQSQNSWNCITYDYSFIIEKYTNQN